MITKYLKKLVACALAVPLAAVCFAYECPVYPKPQQVRLQDSTTTVQEVVVQKRGKKSTGGIWDQLPADKEGAYALVITPGKMEVYANSEEGLFYAKQTVSQLLEGVPDARNAHRDPFPDEDITQVARKGKLPLGTLIDWPDLPFRGTVEGYYGTPWSLQARLSQFDFYGRNKMNVYIYAPKDDPYHHGKGCYEPYPEARAKEIRQMVKRAKKNHVHFVWAIHPANTVRWNVNGGVTDLEALCRKLEQLYELGVRDFGVLVDDSSGEIGKPERQTQLCNYILENFIRKHPDVNQTLIMCPTGYNKSWTNPRFLQTLGNGLDPSIPVMWTGDTVVHDITLSGQRWVNGHVKRPTFIWWNWPCTDFKRSRLSMGRTYGLDTAPDMKNQMSGFVANPMEQAEASKVGLFGVANYTWNIEHFDSVTTWKDGIARLYPKVAPEMQVFCNHNSYLLPNVHGYFREESVEVAPAVQTFVHSVNEGEPDAEACEVVLAEFQRMEKAGEKLLRAPSITELRNEIEPWFKQFFLTGKAGALLVSAIQTKSKEKRQAYFFQAMDIMNDMKDTSRMDWNGGKPKAVEDVEVATKEMTPAMRTAFRYVNARIYAEIAGTPSATPKFTANAPTNNADAIHISDRNTGTFWSNGRRQQAGDWFCLDFGATKDIRTISLVMGGPRANDYAEEGVFEYSNDGTTWKQVGDPTGGPNVGIDLSDSPIRARMLRYRITKPRTNWLSVCIFDVNCTLAPFVSTSMQYDPHFSAFKTGDVIGINRIMEVSNIQAGEYIDLELPSPVHVKCLEINLENADIAKWGKLEVTMSNGQKHTLPIKVDKNRIYITDLPKGRVKSIRLTNKGKQMQPFKLTLFRIGLPEGEDEVDRGSLTDSDLSTFYNCGRRSLSVTLSVPKGCTQVVVVGTATCQVSNATLAQKKEHTQTFTLEPGTRKITIKAPKQAGTRVNEIIFK